MEAEEAKDKVKSYYNQDRNFIAEMLNTIIDIESMEIPISAKDKLFDEVVKTTETHFELKKNDEKLKELIPKSGESWDNLGKTLDELKEKSSELSKNVNKIYKVHKKGQDQLKNLGKN